MIRTITALLFAATLILSFGVGTPARASDSIEVIFETHAEIIIKGSRRTITPAIEAFRDSGLPEAQIVLETWRAKDLWVRKADNRFFRATTEDRKTYDLLDIVTGEALGRAAKKELRQIKPNSGVRGLISAALVRFQLSDPDPEVRRSSLAAIQRDPAPSHLAALEASIDKEDDPGLKAEKRRLAGLLTIQFAEAPETRVAAIRAVSSDLGIDVRAALNPILATRIGVYTAAPEGNVAARLTIGSDIGADEAYALLVAQGAAAPIPDEEKKAALAEHIDGGMVGGVPVASLTDPAARDRAYARLAAAGRVPPSPTAEERDAAIAAHRFYAVYEEPNPAVTDAASEALESIGTMVRSYEVLDLSLDALSLASIYFLAAIGLAITFGVMRVINMAHGEFIMMGAYTGFVVQQLIPSYTISILVALPLAFAITFAAGVTLERLVIRWLYDRPLETLLATFGVSIALQQIAKNIFGTQARPLTSPEWLDGAWDINPIVSISWIRVAIFVLSVVFLLFLLFVLNRTRLGLEVRAVTQNPRMAASMGINPDYIRMMTFGLGSGIAGIAGVAIGLFAKVTSGLGQDYIVQSFMTVVVGGVGNLWGVLAGAGLIGILQKGIEALNPSNTLAAQTYMIIFIIIFIQFRPKGMFALKGRAAGD
ncbi:MAG: urea ABC transporter permease subunit UrtB [Alphaproteobacteria bacterium]|nr:urea ABC transporter permease subunit UrtB [Alphaproteobacteria bacterium]